MVRFCNPITHDKPDCEFMGSAKIGDDIYFCVCNTNLCNSASLIGRPTVNIIAAPVGILCFVRICASLRERTV